MDVWKEIEMLIPVFKSTFKDVIDFDRFNRITLTFHSTAIEGSTLTLEESEVLLDKGVSPAGKPIQHQHMVVDHHQALLYTLDQAEKKVRVTQKLIQEISARVMRNTGSVYNTALGQYDVSKGDLRLNNVRAGSQYFVNYDKVPGLLKELTDKIQEQITKVSDLKEILMLSFDAHFDLVSIHPFGDGNGRTSRLVMNFIQHYHSLPLAIVHLEDRKDYILSLMKSRKVKSLGPLHEFMAKQYIKYLTSEIEKFQEQQQTSSKRDSPSKGNGYSLVF